MEGSREGQQVPRSPLLAGILSGLLPGSGHLYLRKIVAGSINLALFVLFLLAVVLGRVAGDYRGFAVCLLVPTLICVVSSATAVRQGGHRSILNWRWWLTGFVAALLAQFIYFNLEFRAGGFRVFSVPSMSMEPTIEQNEHIIVDTRYFRHRKPTRRDVVVFLHDEQQPVGKLYVVKRIIGVPGDVIEGSGDCVSVNHVKQEETYANYAGSVPPEYVTYGPFTVPDGSYFVMGDHRNISLDSRMPGYGFVRDQDVIGKPIYIFQSPDDKRMGRRIQ